MSNINMNSVNIIIKKYWNDDNTFFQKKRGGNNKVKDNCEFIRAYYSKLEVLKIELLLNIYWNKTKFYSVLKILL